MGFVTGFCLNFKADCYKNAVNKRIIERPIFFPRLRYCKKTPTIAEKLFGTVCQRDNHILFTLHFLC
ncbi:hypothetical protein CUS_7981 [Ruminococcus albus 8]|uniref:Uncharacterized protein n=1 Tax=Ruminococcus albus 8 TaxID=246199 RepID=E9SAL9_RUMAL|nr:hypothetical protein CUS_7981 [Ruminococcus albus 8]